MNRLRDEAPPAPSPETGALVAVDDALTSASLREFFTSGQARDLLLRVHAAVADKSDADERISGIVACAAASFGDGARIDRCRLVDPLLDIRLALCN
jgi:hypothetical protein